MTINCKGQLIDFDCPKVMGILNLTPDSFYDGGKYQTQNAILKQAEKMLTEGATFIDLGSYSSRPGATHIDVEDEKKRLIPVVELLVKEFKNEILLSIDTFRSEVADLTLQIGASIINDISAGQLDTNMLQVVAKHQAPYVMMHMKGNPQNMKTLAQYDNLLVEIKTYFSERLSIAYQKGINDIIIDPGFGFSKSIQHNFELLNHFELFKSFDLPLLCGLSRKSMIYKTLKTQPMHALNGSTALHAIALYKGANILRTHDVKEAVECIKLIQALNA
ncbi:dihydropteroate synthase [Flavobacterium sp. CS20]|uniref:dihydropteroate synthase n=1 Tax=Flavobacterium sp. CS20 TaxID=2775246 RepID=UPI001B3A1E5B|nr:dihydropteroate synthase [Flavobacterium sp. CS20]QTY26609.1 dihydropteroate synthase [Flavobacterium sp. CS20]